MMNQVHELLRITTLFLVLILLGACGALDPTPTPVPPTEAPASVPPTATVPQDSATPTPAPPTSQEPAPFPLSEPGPYYSGNRKYTLVDESRGGREIRLTIMYPALEQTDTSGQLVARDAPADMSGAPYPLILTGPDSGTQLFESHLVSHGFIMAIVRSPDSYDYWDFQVIDHPRDFLFALDQITSNPLGGLEGAIDSDTVGVAGYSGDGNSSLALSGVRVDPEFYLSHCEQAPAIEPALSEWYIEFSCGLAKKWDEFADHVGDDITASEDGLWQPVTDERIRAVMPMAPDGAWLYGERGLAMADRPMLIIAPAKDEYTPYQIETRYIFEHIKTPERFMVSFVGKGHMMVFRSEQARRMNRFATAFFGYYLQGKEEYRDYFSEDFVAQLDDLAWGVYEGE